MDQLVTLISNHQELEKNKIENKNLSFAKYPTNSSAMYLANSDYESSIELTVRRRSEWND